MKSEMERVFCLFVVVFCDQLRTQTTNQKILSNGHQHPRRQSVDIVSQKDKVSFQMDAAKSEFLDSQTRLLKNLSTFSFPLTAEQPSPLSNY